MGTVILVHTAQTKYFNHRNVWVVYHVFRPKITFDIFTGATRKETPKPR